MLEERGAGSRHQITGSYNMKRTSKYPAVWCDFNACGWSGRPDDDCFYVLDQTRLTQLGAKAEDNVDDIPARKFVSVAGEEPPAGRAHGHGTITAPIDRFDRVRVVFEVIQ